MNKDIVFLINRSEITAGTRGASLGPDAVMTAARKKGSTLFGEYPIAVIKEENNLLDRSTPFKFAKRIEGLCAVYNDLDTQVQSLLLNNKTPLVLAGDHGSAGGTIAGIKSAFPTKKLGIVWIDAHADIHTPYTTPSGNMHGMPLAIVLNQDNLACQKNEVSAETQAYWQKLKQVGGNLPKAAPEHLVYIAVRDTEEEEDALMKQLQIKNYTVAELREKGITKMLTEIEHQLQDCDLIYVSFDVDSMDPDLTSRGTGTPVENGLHPEEAAAILTAFALNKKTVCMEFVEVNPCLDDKTNTMAEVAFDLVETVVKAINTI
jgi:arginase